MRQAKENGAKFGDKLKRADTGKPTTNRISAAYFR